MGLAHSTKLPQKRPQKEIAHNNGMFGIYEGSTNIMQNTAFNTGRSNGSLTLAFVGLSCPAPLDKHCMFGHSLHSFLHSHDHYKSMSFCCLETKQSSDFKIFVTKRAFERNTTKLTLVVHTVFTRHLNESPTQRLGRMSNDSAAGSLTSSSKTMRRRQRIISLFLERGSHRQTESIIRVSCPPRGYKTTSVCFLSNAISRTHGELFVLSVPLSSTSTRPRFELRTV